jgi:hypothetical protein
MGGPTMIWLPLGLLLLLCHLLLRDYWIRKSPRPVPRWRANMVLLGICFGLYLWWILWASLTSGSHIVKLPIAASLANMKYCQSAATALEAHLTKRGYAVTDERPGGWPSWSPPPVYERWYQPLDHIPIWVTVYYWREGDMGVGAHMDIRVEWDTIGLRLNKKRINADAAAIEQDLQEWWKKYKASHPGHVQ